MHQSGEIIIRQTDRSDLPALSQLVIEEGKDKLKYLDWWYFQNPSGSFTLFHAEMNGQVVGIASTNNFPYSIGGKRTLVAMPQKVVTHDIIRGRGIFKQLYYKTEETNFKNGVDTFLTFTNAASTPIFLNKFGYQAGVAPKIFFTGFRFSLQRNVREVALSQMQDFVPFQEENALIKNADYRNWRYRDYKPGDLHILQINKNERLVGYAFLRPLKKFGIKVFLLMDLFLQDESDRRYAGRQLKAYAAHKMYLGILFLERNLESVFAFHVPKKINFLVKGADKEESISLSQRSFNFYFGDMDFI